MIKGKRVLSIIPARGGSKRLPKKNILQLAGKPLILLTIETALESKYIDLVLVSTDDNEIAKISKSAGASVPFIRPKDLASDTASTIDVILHAINFLEEMNDFYDYIILLQPTSPLRTSTDIDSALELCIKKNANSVISICETDHPPIWSNTLPPDLSMKEFIKKEVASLRSQDIPTYYRINGAIYIANTSVLKKHKTFFNIEKSYAYIMPRERSIDIDTQFDFLIAETIIKHYKILSNHQG